MIYRRTILLAHYCVLLSLLFVQSALAQKIWLRVYDVPGVGNSVRQTADGGYIISGSSYDAKLAEKRWDFIEHRIFLIKTNVDGDTLWGKKYNPHPNPMVSSYLQARMRVDGRAVQQVFDEEAYDVQQTLDGGYIIVGKTGLSGIAGGEDVYLIKTDSQGETLWTKTYGGENNDGGYSVLQTSDSGYIIAGYTDSYDKRQGVHKDYDVYLIKTNVQGEPIWSRTYGSRAFYDVGYSVQQTQDGGFIIVGYTENPQKTPPPVGVYYAQDLLFEKDVYLIKTDVHGYTLWTKSYGGKRDDIGLSVQQTRDGGYILVGSTQSFSRPLVGVEDVYLIKTDDSGKTLWSRTYGGKDPDIGYSVQQTSEGGYIISASGKAYIIKTNASGALLRATYGKGVAGRSIQQTVDGGYIGIGEAGGRVCLFKTDSKGYILPNGRKVDARPRRQ